MSALPGFVDSVKVQIPERLRDRLELVLYSDPYHLHTKAKFVDRLNPRWQYECNLESGMVGTRRVSYIIPELALARLAASF